MHSVSVSAALDTVASWTTAGGNSVAENEMMRVSWPGAEMTST